MKRNSLEQTNRTSKPNTVPNIPVIRQRLMQVKASQAFWY